MTQIIVHFVIKAFITKNLKTIGHGGHFEKWSSATTVFMCDVYNLIYRT